MNGKRKAFILFILVILSMFVTAISFVEPEESKVNIQAVDLENATVVAEETWIYLPKDISVDGRNHLFQKGERITIIFVKGAYGMAEKYYPSMDGSFFGWVYMPDIEVDEE